MRKVNFVLVNLSLALSVLGVVAYATESHEDLTPAPSLGPLPILDLPGNTPSPSEGSPTSPTLPLPVAIPTPGPLGRVDISRLPDGPVKECLWNYPVIYLDQPALGMCIQFENCIRSNPFGKDQCFESIWVKTGVRNLANLNQKSVCYDKCVKVRPTSKRECYQVCYERN